MKKEKKVMKGNPKLAMSKWRSLSITCVCLLVIGVTAIMAVAFGGLSSTGGGPVGGPESLVRAEIESDKPVLTVESANKTISHRREKLVVDITVDPNESLIWTMSIDLQYDKTLFQYNETATMEAMWDIENPYFADGFTVGTAKDNDGILKLGGMDFSIETPKEYSIVGSLVFDIIATSNDEGIFEIIDQRLPDASTSVPIEIPSVNIIDLTVDLVFADTLELKSTSTILQFVDKDGSVITRTPEYVYNQAVQHFLTQMAMGTKLSQIESQLLVSEYVTETDLEIKFFSALNAPIEAVETTEVKTGMSIQLFSGDIMLDKVILVLRGDANGDGAVDVVDVNVVFNRFNSGTKLADEAQELASRVRGTISQTPNMTDVTRIFNHGFSVDGYNLYNSGYFGTI